MHVTELPLLLLLLVAHMLGDFVLQKSTWVEERYAKHLRSLRLYAHVSIHTALSLAVLWLLLGVSWAGLGLAAIIGGTHFVIDLGKSYTLPGKLSWFLVDQLLHLLVIFLVWVTMSGQWALLDSADLAPSIDTTLILIAYIIAIWPFSVVIGMICRNWAPDIDGLESLANAGKRIGQLERFLILTFILVDQFAAIGFLLAAKSILRFGDTKEANHRKINEYVLLGTMVSFSLTIALGLLVTMLTSAV